MTLKASIIFMIIITSTYFLQSCEKEGNETNISSHNLTESHNMGRNCMECHKKKGGGEGWFTVAGTVYDSLKTTTISNATIKLYTAPNATGTLKYTIDGDANGNFYTTDAIDFSTPLYPAVTGLETTKYMSMAITQGKCNSCHGDPSGNKIWTR